LLLRLGSLIFAFFASTCATASALPNATPSDSASQTNNRIRAVVQSADGVFIGGDFTNVDGQPRNFVARLDRDGVYVSGWRARTNARVYALALSSDGSKLFLAGAFTRVNGKVRRHVAAVRTRSGRLVRSWHANTDATVRALATRRGWLYLGGDFKTVSGKHRVRLAAVTQKSGRVRSWHPLANRAVRSLALSARRTRLFAGGDFTKVAGQRGRFFARENFVAINARDGSITELNPAPGFTVNAIRTVLRTVYLGTGGECADGGKCNSVLAYGTRSGALRWSCQGDGDVHALALSGGVLYAGGHWFDATTRCLSSRRLLALDRTDGSVLGWTPRPNGFGVMALSARKGSRLAVGGEFTKVSTEDHANYAQFGGDIDSTG
jgi:hypothetical protein